MKHWIHLGTQKAASSFLRGLVAQVPQIGLAGQQELNFFGFEDDQSYEAYVKCFPANRSVLFENSPIYFREGSKCAPAIAATLGDMQALLSVLIRDPVEAIISHHEMRLRQGFFKRPNPYAGDPRDLTAFIRQNPDYVAHCRYMEVLERHWLQRFPVDSFEIRTFEEFTANPVETLGAMARRTGLDDIGEVRADKVWKNARPASRLAHRLLIATGRNALLRTVRHGAVEIPGVRRIAERLLFDRSNKPQHKGVESETDKAELAEIFRPDVMRLCKFLGRDSLPWSNFFAPTDPGSPSLR